MLEVSRCIRRGIRRFAFLLQLATLYRDKAGAKAFDAGIVFVAATLVDGAFAAKIGF